MKRSARNQRRPVLRIYRVEAQFAGYCCARCGEKGAAFDRDDKPPDPAKVAKARAEALSWITVQPMFSRCQAAFDHSTTLTATLPTPIGYILAGIDFARDWKLRKDRRPRRGVVTRIAYAIRIIRKLARKHFLRQGEGAPFSLLVSL